MKRLIACFITAAMLLIVLCGCDKEKNNEAGFDFKSAEQKISEKYDYSELYSVADIDELCLVYGVEAEDVLNYYAKYSITGVNSQEIVIIEAVDDAAADRIKSALDIRYTFKVNEAASYSPEQLELVRSSSVVKDGKVVSLIVDKNADDIRAILKGE